jgi:hypothetical protein
MDKFVDDSPFVTQEALECCLPYALIRSMYKQLYDTKAQGKKGTRSVLLFSHNIIINELVNP